ncbi:MAG: hypothetical protein P8M22_10525 [Phycisphaerales bacterium]|nr:hypothetical protein [Phycisphaerales bacterium]
MQAHLAPTVASLGTDLRSILDRLHREGWQAVQLSAAMPGTRPRDLGSSARRDILATLRRCELQPAGMDLWIPGEHYIDPTTVDRVVSTIDAACTLASDLGIDSLSVQLPAQDGIDPDVLEAIHSSAVRRGVLLADHRLGAESQASFGAGLDPAACFAMDRDPVEEVISLGTRLVAPRLSDLMSTGLRGPVGSSDGRLNVADYRAAVVTVVPEKSIALDLRQLASPWEALEAGRQAWRSAGIADA